MSLLYFKQLLFSLVHLACVVSRFVVLLTVHAARVLCCAALGVMSACCTITACLNFGSSVFLGVAILQTLVAEERLVPEFVYSSVSSFARDVQTVRKVVLIKFYNEYLCANISGFDKRSICDFIEIFVEFL